jgi:group I intron endonuclease
MKSGIYKIYFKNTPNKVYIGSSKHCEKREKQHLYDLKKGIHINPLLQYAFNKHLEETFVFEIIEEAEEKMLIAQERYWYAKSIDDGLEVYNVIFPDNHPTNTGKTRFKKGIIPWNKGMKTAKPKEPYSKERHLKKLSESHKGQIPWFKKKGLPPPSNTGRTRFKKKIIN